MLRRCGRGSGGNIMVNAAKLVFVNQRRTIPCATVSQAHAKPVHSPSFANLRSPSCSSRSRCTMSTNYDPRLEKLFEEKRSLRSKIRRELKKMDPILRSQEDDAIQRVVLEAPWFKNSGSICAYISSDALREVDTSRIVSKILSNSVKAMQATEPVDLFILPGLAFDKSGRRLGRNGGYYDVFLEKYQDLIKKQNWKQPLLVALSYSVQITENERIATTPSDVPVDALVSASGFIPISPVAFKYCH